MGVDRIGKIEAATALAELAALERHYISAPAVLSFEKIHSSTKQVRPSAGSCFWSRQATAQLLTLLVEPIGPHRN